LGITERAIFTAAKYEKPLENRRIQVRCGSRDQIVAVVTAGTEARIWRPYPDHQDEPKAAPVRPTDSASGTGTVMFKSINAVLAAAAIAGALTFLSAPEGRLDAGPLAGPAQAVLKTCTQRPWPYLNCVGTPLGNPHIRLVTTDRLEQ
jgi:hypothetical protein